VSLSAAIVECLGEDPTPARPGRLPVAAVARRCPRGEVRPACHRGRDVAVAVLADGRRVVVADRCPHDGGLLSDGFVDGDRLVCARHGWEFDLTTGEAAGRPGRVDVLREAPRSACPAPTLVE
jgi:nitrite reductase/ring-hydroxylating ferredoxin subunit